MKCQPHNTAPPRRLSVARVGLSTLPVLALALTQTGCVTARVEEARQSVTGGGLNSGDAVVLLTRRFNNQREAEEGFTNCVADALLTGHPDMELRTE
ncbi:MAG: hypothetical protein AAFX85_16485, partial [Pseudomonadota bacterium]